MMRTAKLIAAAIAVLTFSSQAMALFTVDGGTYSEKFSDNFDDGVIDGAKWPDTTYLTESGGTLIFTSTGNEQHTTSGNFGSEFTGATEWAYLFRVKVPSTGTWPGNRMGTVWMTPDIRLFVRKTSDTTFRFRAGGWCYTTMPWYWESTDYNMDTDFYEVGIHKEDGLNKYDIFVGGTEVGTDLESTSYSGTPATITFGSHSSTLAWNPVYDYMYAGTPLPPGLTIKKYFDTNEDGSFNGEDAWRSGWVFNVTDGGAYNENHTTDANGEIYLPSLPAGTYTITETLKSDWTLTTGNSPVVVVIPSGGGHIEEFGNNLMGDANMDGLTDTQDFTILKDRLGTAGGWTDADFNHDVLVDTQDFTILKANLGHGAGGAGGAVPEPATMALLAIGAAALVRRRRA
ncbi:MAG: PEP-CTERM sorting domain-containing protein [Planctomycetota bacterium]|jgi:hypothetical protein